MPLQNRVDPLGALHAVSARGLFMGNRGGCFHREDQTLKDRHCTSKRWIICVSSFKGRKRPLMQPGLYTELFFLDEATALAAGHRPCFECRRAEVSAFRGGLITIGPLQAGETIDRLDTLAAGEIQTVLTGARPRKAVRPLPCPAAQCMRPAARPASSTTAQRGPCRSTNMARAGPCMPPAIG